MSGGTHAGGLYGNEQAICDLYDAGFSKSMIALQLGIRKRTVERVLNYLGTDPGADYRDELCAGTTRLLAAIAKHHPERMLS